MDNTLTPADILDRGADNIDALGHAKHCLINAQTGAVCAVGAMRLVSEDLNYCQAVCALQDWLHQDVVVWNNKPERKAYEVTSAMRVVANMLRAAA